MDSLFPVGLRCVISLLLFLPTVSLPLPLGTDRNGNSWPTVTFKLDEQLLMKLWEIFIPEAKTISHVYNVITGMTLSTARNVFLPKERWKLS
jgi:hypothetical protein